MRTIIASAIALALSFSGALAADSAPLTAGKPAGVRQADMGGNGLIFLAGAAIIGIGIAIAVSGNNSNTPTAVSTGTSP